MNTYREIAEEIALNIKSENEIERKLNSIIEAISYAEERLIGKSRAIKFFERVPIDTLHDRFLLPDKFSTASKIVITDRSLARFKITGVEFEELIDYDPSQILPATRQLSDIAVNPVLLSTTSDQVSKDAQYSGSVLYAILRTSDGAEIAIKPKIDGYVFVYYTSEIDVPKDLERNRPSVSKQFYHAIVAGATYYLLRRQSSSLAEEDPNKSIAMLRIATEYKNDFEADIKTLAVITEDRDQPPIVKPFVLYGNPEDDL